MNENRQPDQVSDEEFNLAIRVISRKERRRAVIDGSVEVKSSDYEPKRITIVVGNTGLQLAVFDEEESYHIGGDFIPGGHMEAGGIGFLQAMKVFSYAMLKLRSFLLEEGVLEIGKIHAFNSKTNDVFANFLIRLFEKSGQKDLIKLDSTGERVIIALDALLELDDSNELIKRLSVFASRAEGMEFDALMPLEE